MCSDVGIELSLVGTYNRGESLFSLFRIIPVMLLVSADCDLLKSDILAACYSQVKKQGGGGGALSF
jgi:hypothetical protein